MHDNQPKEIVMRRKLTVAAAIAAAAFLLSVPAALAAPGPGQSHQCAPGQHEGPTQPPACNKK